MRFGEVALTLEHAEGSRRLASRGNQLSSSKSERVGVTPGRDGTSVPPDIALFRRERELALLEAAVERAWSGRGSLIVCTGPAGSGRSKVLSVGAERAEQAGMRVLSATGRSAERDLDFGAALQLFEAEVSRADAEERERLLSGAAALAAPLLTRGPRGQSSIEPTSSILHGLYHLCAHLGQGAPLALVVDDAHCLDAATLRLLVFLSHRLDDLPFLLLLSTGAGASSPELDSLVYHPRATQVRLGPLSKKDTEAWLSATTFADADDEFYAACYDSTLGNRQLLSVLARELSTQPVLYIDHDARHVTSAAPMEIAVAVRLRLAELDPRALGLAEAVAIFGDGAEMRHVAAMMGAPPDQVARVGEQLVSEGLLRGVDRLAFEQPIVRRALYAAVSPSTRAEVHLTAARALHEDGGSEAAIAGHLALSRRTGSDWVVDVLERAAATALERGRPETAVSYLQRALAEPPAAERRDALAVRLGRAEAMTGAPEALGRMRASGKLLTGGAERARSNLWTGRVLMTQGRYRAAADSFRSGLAEPKVDEPLRTLLSVSCWSMARLGYSERLDDPTEDRLPENASTPAGRLELAYAALDAALAGRPAQESRAMALQALGAGALVREDSDGVGPHLAALALSLSGDLQWAEAVLTAVIELSRERGASSDAALAHAVRATAILRRGRLTDVLADLQAARSTHPGAWREASFPTQAILPIVLLEQGRLERADAQIVRWSRSADPTAGIPYLTFLMTRGRLRRLQGRPDEALADFLDCGHRAAELEIFNPAAFPWRSQSALAMLQIGKRGQASALAESELTLARASGAPDTVGHALHVLGTVEDGAEGLRLLEESVEMLETSQAVLLRARALIDFGSALRKTSKQRLAREPLKRGLDLAQRCHAGALVQRGREELALAGARPRRIALNGADSLTARERQVAALARRGHSNREIAEVLVVTLKTVEWHLRQVYRKLEIGSRGELPDDLAEPGTLPR